MAYTIIWSYFAEDQLDQIFAFYEKETTPRIAKKLLKRLINAPNILVEDPFIGQIEELLKRREVDYRYLVVGNYKLIYSVQELHKFIKILDVFDTRQNPPKLKRNK